MIELFEQARLLQDVCESHEWRSCFIGGIALQRWGEPRLTVDADLSLFTGFGHEEGFIDLLLARFQPRIPDAKEFEGAGCRRSSPAACQIWSIHTYLYI